MNSSDDEQRTVDDDMDARRQQEKQKVRFPIDTLCKEKYNKNRMFWQV